MLDKDCKYYTINKLIRSGVCIFIDTFFSVYFFTLVDYRILPMAKYYLMIYLALPFSFFLIRNAMKRNIKLPYYRISISLLGIFLATILLLKENIPTYIMLVGFIKGLSEGFYYYPVNVFDTEKITNENRVKYTGLINTVNEIIAIVVPLILGVTLNYMSYINVGKIVMLFVVLMFGLSFNIKEAKECKKKFEFKKFLKKIKGDRDTFNIIKIRTLQGLTYSSSVLLVIISLYSIIFFKENLYVGFYTSACAIITLGTTTLFALKSGKHDKLMVGLSMVFITIALLLLIVYPCVYTLLFYSFIETIFIVFINLLNNVSVFDFSNSKLIKRSYKAEYNLLMELCINAGRIIGYIAFVIIGLIGTTSDFSYIIAGSAVCFVLLAYYTYNNISE